MNQLRREKLKKIILKLPLGSQLLQLRRKIIELRHKKAIKLRCKHKEKLQQEKAIIRQSKNSMQRKYELHLEARLRNLHYYYLRSTKNIKRFSIYSQLRPEQVTVFEIGTGPALGSTIGMSLMGFKKIISVDICRASPQYVQMVYRHYKKYATNLGIKFVPRIKEKITDENLNRILLENFKIDYRAPYDAAHTDLPNDSVEYVFANLVFNFVHVELLPGIIKEAFRILHGGGVMYVFTNYSDRRAVFDSEFTPYDYLQYTDEEWKKYNSWTYQNRLRTADYRAMFIAAGFEIVDFNGEKITDADRAAFATVKVADELKKKYTDEELLERGGQFILRKP